jgi:hypothetical protein
MLIGLQQKYRACVIMKKRLFPTRNFPFTRKALAMLRLRTVRCGVWFKRLCRYERNLLELVIRVTKLVRSQLLAKLLYRIVNRLLNALDGRVALLMRTIGRSVAQRLTKTAQRWGNVSASKWLDDPGFTQYLAVMHLNTCDNLHHNPNFI